MSTLTGLRNPFLSSWVWLGLPGLLVVGLYAPLFPGLVREWAEFPNLSHGFAIPLIAAYLVWARADRLRATPIVPSVWGLPVLVLGLGALVVGVHGEEPFLARISLPVTLLGMTMFLAGLRITREVWIGIAYLAFMIPLPWATIKLITYRSRLFDAAVSAEILNRVGVPVYQDGVMLHLPSITLEVADACSSIPAIAALLSLGVAYGSMVQRPLWVRAVLVLSTLPFAIGANILRIVTTAWAAYSIGHWTLRTAYHMFNGTVNFMITFLLLLALDTALARLSRRWSR
jgi:exosortase